MTEYKIQGELNSQLGGHGHFKKLHGPIASMAKPLLPREKYFYKHIKSTPLVYCIPKYLGSISYDDRKWLILQDLTAGIVSPCVADLKIGTRTFEVGVSYEKASRQISLLNNTTTPTHAIRCIDICTRKNGALVQHWDRNEGRKMTPEQLKKALKVFIGDSLKRKTKFNEELITLINRLNETEKMYPNLRLYSASVLLVYDGDKENSGILVKLIDFGHAYIDVEAEGGNPKDSSFDDNALIGLKNLYKFVNN